MPKLVQAYKRSQPHVKTQVLIINAKGEDDCAQGVPCMWLQVYPCSSEPEVMLVPAVRSSFGWRRLAGSVQFRGFYVDVIPCIEVEINSVQGRKTSVQRIPVYSHP